MAEISSRPFNPSAKRTALALVVVLALILQMFTMLAPPARANAGSWAYPEVGDVFSGWAECTGVDVHSNTVENIYLRCTSGDCAGSTYVVDCSSGHDFAAPLVGQGGTYYAHVYSVDKSRSTDNVVYEVIWDNSENYDGYQNGARMGFTRSVAYHGDLAITKTSSNPSITDGNDFYALDATYEIFTDSGCTNYVKSVTLGDDGHGTATQLTPGTYYVKESIAATGYELDETVHSVTVPGGGTATLSVTDEPSLGAIDLTKTSSAPNITDSNACYNMSGIKYDVYTDEACTSFTGKQVEVDAQGHGTLGNLPLGTYYLKENVDSAVGTGYVVDDDVHEVVVSTKDATYVGLMDDPGNDPIDVFIQKKDALTGRVVGSGSMPMAGAVFEVKYWDTMASGDVAPTTAPTRTWKFQTNDLGMARLNALDYFVGGDALYTTQFGNIAYPIGTYTIQEVTAPVGYLLPEDNDPYVFKVTEDTANHDFVASLPADGVNVIEKPIRHDFSFVKISEGSQDRMPNVAFMVKRMAPDGETVLEQHVIVTDVNGHYSSADNVNTNNTNGNDAAVSKNAKGEWVVDESKLDPSAGLWFGIGEDGQWAEPNDFYGSIPDSPNSTYVIEEIYGKANVGHNMVDFALVAHGTEAKNFDLGTVTDPTPTIGTAARDYADDDTRVERGYTVRIADLVTYAELEPGDYEMRGTIVYKQTGEPVLNAQGTPVTASHRFSPKYTIGAVELYFDVDTSTMEEGTELVVFEDLYKDGEKFIDHEDIDDMAQTVRVIAADLFTYATSADDAKTITKDVQTTIVDRVRALDLTKNKTFTISGILMDKATGQPYIDATGSQVTAQKTFRANGDPILDNDVTFTFDCSNVENGTELVVFETLYADGNDVGSHADIDDEYQTVKIVEPSIATSASDKADGDKEISGANVQTVVDEVELYGLIPEMKYGLSAVMVEKASETYDMSAGTLFSGPQTASMVKEALGLGSAYTVATDDSGRARLVTKSGSGYIIEAASGYVVCGVGSTSFKSHVAGDDESVEITLCASEIADATQIVCFETLVREGKTIATHADIEDEDQTLVVVTPGLATQALNGATQGKLLDPVDVVRVVDTVDYKGLMSGANYTVSGILMDKTTGQAVECDDMVVTSEASFKAASSAGTTEVEFVFDATGLEGHDLVVFEYLSEDDVLVAEHADINDEAQTVTVSETVIPIDGSPYAKTGALLLVLPAGIIAIGVGLCLVAYAQRQRELEANGMLPTATA